MTAALAAAFTFVKGDWRLFLLLGLAAGLGVVVWRIYAAGAASEVARQNVESLGKFRERVVIDEKLDRKTIEELCCRAGGAMAVSGCNTVGDRLGDGLKLVTPLQPAAAVCLAETDPASTTDTRRFHWTICSMKLYPAGL